MGLGDGTAGLGLGISVVLLAGGLCDLALQQYFARYYSSPNVSGSCNLDADHPNPQCPFLPHSRRKWGRMPAATIVAVGVTVVFLSTYGFSAAALRRILLCQILAVVGIVDGVTWEIPDVFHLLVFAVGLVGFRPLPALCGLLLVPFPLLAAALKTGKVGGGDVKLMAACGFALGVSTGVRMLVWGLAAGLLWNAVFHKGRRSFPLAPFLASGCFVALLPW